MISTSSSSLDFPKQLVKMTFDAIGEANRQSSHTLWNFLISFLSQNWIWVFLIIFGIFLFATFKAMFGKWGSLGSFLYNLFYFGILFIIGLIWGPEIFINDIFKASCAIVLYPICYLLVGAILDKTGLGRHR